MLLEIGDVKEQVLCSFWRMCPEDWRGTGTGIELVLEDVSWRLERYWSRFSASPGGCVVETGEVREQAICLSWSMCPGD